MVMNIIWIDINNEPIPIDEPGILVSHKHGVEYIIWCNGCWCYCYSNGRGIGSLINNITHWCKPEKANHK